MTSDARKVVLFRHSVDEAIERPEGVRTSWHTITPDYAMKVLDEYEAFCDKHPEERMNRPVHQSQVARYATDMAAGRWGRNHQGIAFDVNGILLDGQHRLWAVVESKVTVQMQVTHGLDREAQLTIDAGLKRSTADVASIAGFEGVRPLHVSIVKAMVRGTSATRPAVTRMQELEMLKDHWAALQFVLPLFPKSKVPGLTRAPVLAGIARASYTQDRNLLKRFSEILVSGMSTGDPREQVIITLRNWLITERKNSSGHQASVEAYGKTIRAIQAYIKGERLRTLYASKDDLFKMPILRKKN